MPYKMRVGSPPITATCEWGRTATLYRPGILCTLTINHKLYPTPSYSTITARLTTRSKLGP